MAKRRKKATRPKAKRKRFCDISPRHGDSLDMLSDGVVRLAEKSIHADTLRDARIKMFALLMVFCTAGSFFIRQAATEEGTLAGLVIALLSLFAVSLLVLYSNALAKAALFASLLVFQLQFVSLFFNESMLLMLSLNLLVLGLLAKSPRSS